MKKEHVDTRARTNPRVGRTEADVALRAAVSTAVLAPSGHNSQPWLFRLVGGRLELRRDRTRSLPIVDPDDRALYISLGAALDHLLVALRVAGHRPAVTILPRPHDDPDLAAEVTLSGHHQVNDRDTALLDATRIRHTDRRPFDKRSLPTPVLAALTSAVTGTGAELVVVDEQRRDAIADLIRRGGLAQFSDARFRAELASWLHWNHTRARDGMPGRVHGMDDLSSVAGAWVIRTLDLGRSQAAKDRRLLENSAAVVVLATSGDRPVDWLTAGRAVSGLLLTATTRGISASFLNQPIEVAALRPELESVLEMTGHAQLLVRLGYSTPSEGTPRRSVEEVLG
jgi:hypothetical protein